MKSPGVSKKRILVVEDEPAIRRLCHRILTAEGFEVDTAANGKDGEDRLKEREDYSLILLISGYLKWMAYTSMRG